MKVDTAKPWSGPCGSRAGEEKQVCERTPWNFRGFESRCISVEADGAPGICSALLLAWREDYLRCAFSAIELVESAPHRSSGTRSSMPRASFVSIEVLGGVHCCSCTARPSVHADGVDDIPGGRCVLSASFIDSSCIGLVQIRRTSQVAGAFS